MSKEIIEKAKTKKKAKLAIIAMHRQNEGQNGGWSKD